MASPALRTRRDRSAVLRDGPPARRPRRGAPPRSRQAPPPTSPGPVHVPPRPIPAKGHHPACGQLLPGPVQYHRRRMIRYCRWARCLRRSQRSANPTRHHPAGRPGPPPPAGRPGLPPPPGRPGLPRPAGPPACPRRPGAPACPRRPGAPACPRRCPAPRPAPAARAPRPAPAGPAPRPAPAGRAPRPGIRPPAAAPIAVAGATPRDLARRSGSAARAQIPYALALICLVGGIVWAWRGSHDVGNGAALVGGGLLAAAVARLLLPPHAVGLLASRRRFADVLALGALGAGLLLIALVLPPT